MRAHQIMNRSVVTVSPETSIVDAAKLMLSNHVGCLPVVDAEDKLIGIVTDGDFIRRAELGTQRRRGRWLSFLLGRHPIAADFVHAHGRTVGEIMTLHPITVTEGATLAEIVHVMEKKGIKRLPVVSGDKVVGMVSYADFVQAIAEVAAHVPSPTPDDDLLRDRILDALKVAACQFRRFNVIVRDGVAHLSGPVRDEQERATALCAARCVAGVKEASDHMWIYPPADEDSGGDLVSPRVEPPTEDDQPL